MAIATVTSKGQLTVPKEIREALGLKPGDRVELTEDGPGRAVLQRARVQSVLDLLGMFPSDGMSLTPEAVDEAIGQEIEERYRRSFEG